MQICILEVKASNFYALTTLLIDNCAATAYSPLCNARYFQLQFIPNTWDYLTPALIVMGLGVIILDMFLILAIRGVGNYTVKALRSDSSANKG